MVVNLEVYKIYQLVHFFVCKFGYKTFLIKNLAKKEEIWLINPRNTVYNIIRLSEYSLDDTFNDEQRIRQYTTLMSKALKGVSADFVDIHVGNETVTELEKFKTLSINSNFYDGEDIALAFPGIKTTVHEVDDPKEEINLLITDINESAKRNNSNIKAKLLNNPYFSVTNIVIVICTIIYLLSLLSQFIFGRDLIFILTANFRPYVVYNHEFYRLLTYGFEHGSIFHLLMNMYALYIMGNLIERKYGSLKYAIILLLAILIGGLTHCAFAPKAASVGISAGIYSLFTIYIIDALKNGAYRSSGFMSMVALNLMLNFLPNVAWQAHLGGLVAGFIFYMMFDNYKINKSYIFVILIVIIALVVKMYIL